MILVQLLLGSLLDEKMSMVTHTNKICKAASCNLYNVRRIRKYLTTEASQTLVQAVIIGRIDYCNSLGFKIPAVHVKNFGMYRIGQP